MCIICVKNVGVDMPSEETMRNMWDNNPDGAGFMWYGRNRVNIRKGFMEWKDFLAAITFLQKSIDVKNTPVIMHFRITTHGGTKPENCHPFPVSENVGLLKKLDNACDMGVAHNGIINNSPRAGISDTMEFVVSQLSIMKQINGRFLEHGNFNRLIENQIGWSKLAFIDKHGKVFLIGRFVEDETTNLIYSNENYKPKVYQYKYPIINDYGNIYTKRKEIYVNDVWERGGSARVEGELVDGEDFFIDNKENLYFYDYDLDGLVPIHGEALTTNLTPMKYNKELKEKMWFPSDYLYDDEDDFPSSFCY